jgi:hypothetical protein
VGARSGQGHRRGGGPRRSGSAAALRDFGEQLSATESHRGEGRGQRRFLISRRTPGTPRRRRRRGDGSGRRWRTTAAARRTAGERGQRELERGRGNWSASRVADVGAELTVAEGTTELQRRRGSVLGRRRFNGGGALACAQRGEVGEGSAGAQMREGERACEALGSSDRGEVVASSTRDVGAESAAREDRGGGYAKTEELTARARKQGERGKRARARDWAGWAERPRGGAGLWASFPFSFILAFVFSFLFIYSI